MTDHSKKTQQNKPEDLNKKREKNSGIPIENENVSKDPNRSPVADDKNTNTPPPNQKIPPYDKKLYQDDPKHNK